MNIPPYSKNKLITYIQTNPDIPKFSFKGNSLWAWCSKVVDGDTIHACFFIGDSFLKFNIRLMGIDTPELRSKDKQEKQRAIDAKNFLISLILDKPIYLVLDKSDKYGRLLGFIHLDETTVNTDDNMMNSINQLLIDRGHAVVY